MTKEKAHAEFHLSEVSIYEIQMNKNQLNIFQSSNSDLECQRILTTLISESSMADVIK